MKNKCVFDMRLPILFYENVSKNEYIQEKKSLLDLNQWAQRY
jgi:hypothetical protein